MKRRYFLLLGVATLGAVMFLHAEVASPSPTDDNWTIYRSAVNNFSILVDPEHFPELLEDCPKEDLLKRIAQLEDVVYGEGYSRPATLVERYTALRVTLKGSAA